MQFQENYKASERFRAEYRDSLNALIAARTASAAEERKSYAAEILAEPERCRKEFRAMLGWPLTEPNPREAPTVTYCEKLTEENGVRVYRMQFDVIGGLKMTGLLFRQIGSEPRPLVISQHGGDGTPERVSGLFESTSNYNEMTERILATGVHVFSPQLLLWHKELYGASFNRQATDVKLKSVGSSIAAIEIYAITRLLDYFERQPYVSTFGMVGLSYGGFYTLYTAAAEPRILSAISCGYMNCRKYYPVVDWSWLSDAYRYDHAEVACLVYPRRLVLQIADNDNIFNVNGGIEAFNALKENLGERADWADCTVFEGTHEFCRDDAPIARLAKDLFSGAQKKRAELTLAAKPIPHPHLTKQIVHRADAEFPFLHDTMIAHLGGRLLLAWYNCTEDEIAGRTVIRGRWSDDGGKTWGESEIICEDTENGLHMVPVTFTEYNGEIWAYVTQMTGHDRPVGYVCVHYENGSWVTKEKRNDRVLFNTLPQIWHGKWVVGGRMAAKAGELPLVPMVAFAEPAEVADWKIIPLPGPWDTGEFPYAYPETTVLVSEDKLVAVTRRDEGIAQYATSSDGVSWSGQAPCDLPILPAKMCGGTLADGRQFLVYNEFLREDDRSRLVLALRDNADSAFSKAWILADGLDDELNGGPNWHYPCVSVVGNTMYISCTVSKGEEITRHAALFTLPVDEL
ncbi:MAG: exo-alpha-sialidase [Clostridia bacterium]|nr:exo-alpha-sialidase [Clostridia bacterium]